MRNKQISELRNNVNNNQPSMEKEVIKKTEIKNENGILIKQLLEKESLLKNKIKDIEDLAKLNENNYIKKIQRLDDKLVEINHENSVNIQKSNKIFEDFKKIENKNNINKQKIIELKNELNTIKKTKSNTDTYITNLNMKLTAKDDEITNNKYSNLKDLEIKEDR